MSTQTEHKIALAFEDGITKFIPCGEDQTVADAAYQSKINIPFDCRDGACGTCKAFCESGDFDEGDFVDDAMTQDELDNGFCLPCQATLRHGLADSHHFRAGQDWTGNFQRYCHQSRPAVGHGL